MAHSPDSSILLARATSHVETEVNGQIVAMSVEQGKYFAFKDTAKAIWTLLRTPMTRADLVTALTENYKIDADRCNAEITPFLAELLANGLIEERSL